MCTDDTTLVHTSSVIIQAALNACASFAIEQRFHFSNTKTNILTFNKTTIEINYYSV